jgi:hypothetical protein
LVEKRIRNANLETIQAALASLREEERAAKPDPNGFHDSERVFERLAYAV